MSEPGCSRAETRMLMKKAPSGRAQATGLLNIDWADFVWPLFAPKMAIMNKCINEQPPTKMLAVQPFRSACIESIATLSPTGLLCLSSLIVYVGLFAFPNTHAGFYLFLSFFVLCISQQCTFSASIGSFRSWTTSKHLKMEELGSQGPLSRASWLHWLQMVRKQKTKFCTALVNGIITVYSLAATFFSSHSVFFWFEEKCSNQSTKLI